MNRNMIFIVLAMSFLFINSFVSDKTNAQSRPVVVNPCNICPWQYVGLNYIVYGVSYQVVPLGTTGILHGIWIDTSYVSVYDGTKESGTYIGNFTSTVNTGWPTSEFIELNIKFYNGITITGGNGGVTVLYRLE